MNVSQHGCLTARVAATARLALVLVATAGCTHRTPPADGEAPVIDAPKDEAAANADPEPVADAISLPQVTEAMANDAFQRWLGAQNEADYAAYSQLYAERFTGVKRAGPRVHNLNRQLWLADRKRMFDKPMRVNAANLDLRLGVGTATVRFEQEWSSERFADKGPKELVFLLENGELKIAREEMLASKIEGQSGPPPLSLHPIVSVGNTQYLVLEGTGANTPSPTLSVKNGLYVALGTAQPEPTLASWLGAKLRVLTDRGTSCQAVGQELVAMVRAVPHFGEIETWKEQKLSAHARAQLLFSSAEPVFALRLSAASTPCQGKWLLAQQQSAKPAVPTRAFEDAALLSEAVSLFHQQPEYKQIQRAYDKENHASPGEWVKSASAQLTSQGYQEPVSGRRFVWVHARAGDSCGGWSASMAALFEVGTGPHPKITVLKTPLAKRLAEASSLLSLVDADGNGTFEALITELDGLQPVLVNDRGQDVQRVAANYRDCPC